MIRYCLLLLALCSGVTYARQQDADKAHCKSPIWEEIKRFKKEPEIKQQLKIKDSFVKNMAGLVDTAHIANSKATSFDRALSHFFLNIFPGGVLRFGSDDGLILLTEEKTPLLFNLIKELCQKMSLPMPVIFLSGNTKLFNAFASSLSHGLSLVVLGQDLLKKLSTSELKLVLAHELSHVKHSHVSQQLALALVGNLLLPAALIYWIHSLDDGINVAVTGNPNRLVSFFKSGLGQIIIWSGMSIVTTMLLLSRSRRFEKDADLTALEVTKDAQNFISMIEKVEEKFLEDKESFEASCELVDKKIKELAQTSPKTAWLLSSMLESHRLARVAVFDSVLDEETGDHPSCSMRKKYAQEFDDTQKKSQINAANEPVTLGQVMLDYPVKAVDQAP